MSTVKEAILNGEAVLGIELGSTRIKAVLIDGSCKPVASGSYDWENQLENGIWTYALDEVWKGLQGKLRGPERGCKAEIRRDSDKAWGSGNQRHDARLYGI